MPAKRAPSTTIPDPFILDASTLAWLEKRHPQVDPEVAVERFTFWACEYQYSNWQRTFQNFLTREADNNKLGPMLKKVKPKTIWDDLLAEADRIGFRRPREGEKIESYRAEIEAVKARTVSNVVTQLRSVMK